MLALGCVLHVSLHNASQGIGFPIDCIIEIGKPSNALENVISFVLRNRKLSPELMNEGYVLILHQEQYFREVRDSTGSNSASARFSLLTSNGQLRHQGYFQSLGTHKLILKAIILSSLIQRSSDMRAIRTKVGWFEGWWHRCNERHVLHTHEK